MKITKEIIEKINPFILCVPKSPKFLIMNSEAKHLNNNDDDDDMPEFNDSIPVTVARATVAYKKQLEDESIHDD